MPTLIFVIIYNKVELATAEDVLDTVNLHRGPVCMGGGFLQGGFVGQGGVFRVRSRL